MGLVIIRINVLWRGQVNGRRDRSQKYTPFSPSSSGRSIGCEFVYVDKCGDGTYNLRPKATWALESWENIVTRGLS